MPRTAVPCVLLLMVCACDASELPAPTLSGVTPAEMSQDAAEPLTVTVRFKAQLPVKLDYSLRAAEQDKGLSLRLANEELSNVTVTPGTEESSATAVVPPGRLPVGQHALRLTLADGRVAELPDAFTVRPPPAVTGYAFDTIPDQNAGVAFPITVRAQGNDPSKFNGFLMLSSNRDAQNRQVVPSQRIGPFQAGEYQMNLTIAMQNGNVTLIVDDETGKQGRSNPFKVK
jgi:hypothetical protein